MKKRILYCGDDTLDGGARYLGGVLMKAKHAFHYLPSKKRPTRHHFSSSYDLTILSDYPSARFLRGQLEILASKVALGSSLLMIGGWGSFRGFDGCYDRSILKEVLPVRCQKTDDRQQGAVTYRMKKNSNSSFFRGFDFSHVPGIAGYNKVFLKPKAEEILSVETWGTRSGNKRLKPLRRDPLLVVGHYGRGRVGALMTDLAPHWAGGWVDWGKKRLKIRVTPRVWIEIGEDYFRFVKELVRLFL